MDQRKLASLSPQQRRCLRAVSRGLNSLEIAHELGIAESTVNGHIESAVRKLGAPNRRHAAFALLQSEQPTPPDNLTGQILPVDDQPATPAKPSADKVLEVRSPYIAPDALLHDKPSNGTVGESEKGEARTPLQTIAIILAIAAALSLVLVAYPSLVRNARDIANAIQPYRNGR